MFRHFEYSDRLLVDRDLMSPFQEFLKRGFDIAVAIAGLLLLSPLIVLVSLAITLESRGPVLCRYKCYDLNDTAFEVFEFRSTIAGPKDEKCVTWIGLILRRSGIDKIPQLINVLRGDMSIIGPHPYTTAPGRAYGARIAQCQLHNVRPGLVSWAQVNEDQPENTNAAERFRHGIEYDCYYLENRSFLFDMKILFLALLSKSTYT